MMKKLLLPAILILFSFVIAACGDNEEVTELPPGEPTNPGQDTEENQDTTDGNTVNDNTTNDQPNEGATDNTSDLDNRYKFTEFNLDADIDGQEDAIDIDFEIESNGIEAKYINQPQEINLTGDDALDELDSIFMAFRFDEESSNEEILDEVYEAFNVPEGATDVELDITFISGVEREFNQ